LSKTILTALDDIILLGPRAAPLSGDIEQLLVRGIGPALAAFGVEGALADPRIDVHADVNGRDTIVAANDNWGTGGAAGTLRAQFAAVGAFDLPDTGSRDAALLATIEGARTKLALMQKSSSRQLTLPLEGTRGEFVRWVLGELEELKKTLGK
jgi:hypothetical protein